jgi:thiamine biosynthesis lipoprotein
MNTLPYPKSQEKVRPAFSVGSALASPGAVRAADVMARVQASARSGLEGNLYKLEFRAMGTVCRVHLHGVAPAVARDFCREVVDWTARYEAKYSRFIPDSLIGRINEAAGRDWVETDAETDTLFKLCSDLFFITRGAFDPTALPLMRLWNWKQSPPVLPVPGAIAAARELVGWNKVQRRPGGIFLPSAGMAIDLGGIGKEYAVDCVINLAVERQIPNVMVDFGQDVRVRGHAPGRPYWWIGLDDPKQTGTCWAGVAVTDHAVATSGDYLRHFVFNGQRYGHIIDPRTGYPALNDVLAVSVIAPSCTVAGLISTSVCILGAKEGLHLAGFMHPAAAVAVTTPTAKLHSRTFHEFIPTK